MFDTSEVLTRCGIAAVQAGSHASSIGWTATENRARFAAVCPADGQTSAHIAESTADDYQAILACAEGAQKTWRDVPAPRRGEFVKRIGELVAEHMDDLACAVMLDTGKSVMEAKGELREVIDMATLAAGQARMLYGYSMQSQRAQHRMYDQWLPLGVVGIISAYNFPAAVWAQNAAIP